MFSHTQDEISVTLTEMIWPALGWQSKMDIVTCYWPTLCTKPVSYSPCLSWRDHKHAVITPHSTTNPLLNTQNHTTGHLISIKHTNPGSNTHSFTCHHIWRTWNNRWTFGIQFLFGFVMESNSSQTTKVEDIDVGKLFSQTFIGLSWKTEWNFVSHVCVLKRNSSPRDENYGWFSVFCEMQNDDDALLNV